eukprot:scaffold63488_cov51-Attheya_sp.AAC.3
MTMLWIVAFFLVSTTFSLVVRGDDTMVIGGYMPDYRSSMDMTSAALNMTDLILFSVSPDSDGSIDGTCCLNKDIYKKAREARTKKSETIKDSHGVTNESYGDDLKIWVSVGGGGRSDGFGSIARDERKRARKEEQLDGVDFDWEQPANQEEFIYYLHLIVEASVVFRKEGILLSVAVHYKQVLPEDVYDAVDRIHLMAYDMKPPSSGDFHFARFDMVQDAVETLLKSGCPSSKIILGIPSYARHVHNHGLVQTYADIIQVHSEDFDRDLTYDDIADFAEYDDFVFQSPMDVETKVGYAKYKNLGGIFLWEIGQDQQQKPFAPGGILLSAAAHAMSEEHTNSRETDGQPKETTSAGGEL